MFRISLVVCLVAASSAFSIYSDCYPDVQEVPCNVVPQCPAPLPPRPCPLPPSIACVPVNTGNNNNNNLILTLLKFLKNNPGALNPGTAAPAPAAGIPPLLLLQLLNLLKIVIGGSAPAAPVPAPGGNGTLPLPAPAPAIPSLLDLNLLSQVAPGTNPSLIGINILSQLLGGSPAAGGAGLPAAGLGGAGLPAAGGAADSPMTDLIIQLLTSALNNPGALPNNGPCPAGTVPVVVNNPPCVC